MIRLGIKIHRRLGPGLLESVYEKCLGWELQQANVEFPRQVPLPVVYEGIRIASGYRADIVVKRELILETKSIELILPIHESQMLTYLRLSGCRIGLLMNFNSVLLKNGLRLFVL
ncbi:MAG: GxxExxY protein [Acetobacteraceae bacterium]|nr:GxxExxY protein [Acetobacteraceae bacterium]